jgi:hypothetical protein
MHYKEAKNKSIVKILMGLVIVAIGFITTIISLLKMMYFNSTNASPIGNALGQVFKKLVYFIYEHTKFLNIFWEYCPTPNISQTILFSHIDNLYFLICYLLIFIGSGTYHSGKKLFVRIKEIDLIIENQLIQESMRGELARTREEIENTTHINNSTMFSQVHQLYLAPLIVAIVGGILLKVFGY